MNKKNDFISIVNVLNLSEANLIIRWAILLHGLEEKDSNEANKIMKTSNKNLFLTIFKLFIHSLHQLQCQNLHIQNPVKELLRKAFAGMLLAPH